MKRLKQIYPGIIKHLTFLINQSLRAGIFPDELKVAILIPVAPFTNMV